jgi:hypothetical protein
VEGECVVCRKPARADLGSVPRCDECVRLNNHPCGKCGKATRAPKGFHVAPDVVLSCRTCNAKQHAAEAKETEEEEKYLRMIRAKQRAEHLDSRRADNRQRLKSLEGLTSAEAISLSDPAHRHESKHADHSWDSDQEPPRQGGEEEKPPKKEPCPRLASGYCLLGADCDKFHWDVDIEPTVLPTLDPPIPDVPVLFRKRKDPYGDNPNNPHLRTVEPMPSAWTTYHVPVANLLGLRQMSCQPTAKMWSEHYAKYIDQGEHQVVRLLHPVVDIMRLYFRTQPRSETLAELITGMHQCARHMSTLRVTAEEEDRHVQYATLVAYYDRSFEVHFARAAGSAIPMISILRVAAQVRVLTRAYRGHAIATLVSSLAIAYAALQRLRARAIERAALAAVRAGAEDAAGSIGPALAHWLSASDVVAKLEAARTTVQDGAKTVGNVLSLQGLPPTEAEYVSPMRDVIVMPIVEELFKHPVGTDGKPAAFTDRLYRLLAILAIEWAHTTCRALFQQPAVATGMIAARGAATLMHVATALMPVYWATMVHSYWNFAVAPRIASAVQSLHVGPAATRVPVAVAAASTGLLGVGALVGHAIASIRPAQEKVRTRTAELQAQLAQHHAGQGYVAHQRHWRAGDQPVKVFPAERMVPAETKPAKPGVRIIPTTGYVRDAAWAKRTSEVAEADPRCPPGGFDARLDDRRCIGQVQYGCAVPGTRAVVPAHSAENVEAVVRNRIALDTPLADPHTALDFIVWRETHRSLLYRWPNGTPLGHVDAVSTETFIDRVGSTPATKALLRRTWEAMKREGYHPEQELSERYVKWLCRHKVFIKREQLSLRGDAGVEDKAARPIVPCNPRLLLIIGPWLMAFQGALTRVFSHGPLRFAGAGTTNEQIGGSVMDRVQRGNLVFDDDCGTWDMTMENRTAPVTAFDIAFYRRCGMPRAAALCAAQDTEGFYVLTGWLVHKPGGQMNSGKPDTWSANGQRNGETHMYVYCRSFHRTVEQAAREIQLWLSGDDNVGTHPPSEEVGLPPGQVPDWLGGMRELGHKSEPHYPTTPETTGFCSKVIMHSSDGWKLTPLVGRLLSRFGRFVDPPVRADARGLVRGAALSQYREFAHVPPARAFLDRMLELTAGATPVYPKAEPHRIRAAKASEPTHLTELGLWSRYAWNKVTKAEFEDSLKPLVLGDDISSHWAHYATLQDVDGPVAVVVKPRAEDSSRFTVPPFSQTPHLQVQPIPITPGDYPDKFELLQPGAVDRFIRRILAEAREHRSLGWERDLCAEGIEPNPGPTPEEIKDLVTALASLSAAAASALVIASSWAGEVKVDTVQQFVVAPGHPRLVLDLPMVDGRVEVPDLCEAIKRRFGLLQDDYYLIHRGKSLASDGWFQPDGISDITIMLRLRGGATSKKKRTAAPKVRVVVARSIKKTKRARTPRSVRFDAPPVRVRITPPARAPVKPNQRGTKALVAKVEQSNAATARAVWKGMNDPFNYTPPPLGTGVGSTVFTNRLFWTSQTGTTADGILKFILVPRGVSDFEICLDSTLGTAGTWSWGSLTGGSNLSTNFSEGRYLAQGVRWQIMLPRDKAPGFATAGLIECLQNTGQVTSIATQDLITRNGMTTLGGEEAIRGELTWRPMDGNDGNFGDTVVASSTSYITTPLLVVVLHGWPTGTRVLLELIKHVEVVPKPEVFFGIPVSLSTAAHDYSAVLDVVRDVAGALWHRVVKWGADSAIRWATSIAAGSSVKMNGPQEWKPPQEGATTADIHPSLEPAHVCLSTKEVLRRLEQLIPTATGAAKPRPPAQILDDEVRSLNTDEAEDERCTLFDQFMKLSVSEMKNALKK